MQIIKQLSTGILFFLIVAVGCVTKPASMSKVDYDEDLSVHRPNYSDSLITKEANNTVSENETYTPTNVKPSHDVTRPINMFLDSLAQKNRQYEFYTGYTVQVYSGSERQKGSETKDDVYMVLPDSKPTLSFEAPFWKVKVGKFYSVMEAQKTFVKLKSEFPNAIIVPEQFKLNQ